MSDVQPLDFGFNAAVMTIANKLFPLGYDVADQAPSTLAALTDHVNSTGRMLVWSGASDHTIFGCPEHNWAFRAWHDWCHWKGQFAFTLEGEGQCAEMQKEHIRTLYGRDPIAERFCKLIDCEVSGRAEHFAATGEFPADQVAFAHQHLA